MNPLTPAGVSSADPKGAPVHFGSGTFTTALPVGLAAEVTVRLEPVAGAAVVAWVGEIAGELRLFETTMLVPTAATSATAAAMSSGRTRR